MSTDNTDEWSIQEFVEANPVPTDEEEIESIFKQAQDALKEMESAHDTTAVGDTIKVASLELRIMQLTEKLELATMIIDQQKAEIARLKGDN